MSGFRLARGGEAIDRESPIEFVFDRRRLAGFRGDTLASALIANGVAVVARSFKLHRPRGIVAAGIEEPNAIVQLLAPFEAPNILATALPLADGLIAASVKGWPSVRWDVGTLADALRALLPAGFYYKTFKGPLGAWRWYEPWIRRAAGLGRAPSTPAPVESQRRFAHCEVLVIGAGPAGLAAALVCARSGVRVILAYSGSQPGESLAEDSGSLVSARLIEWRREVLAELDSHANVQRLARTTVTGCYAHDLFVAIERHGLDLERLWKIRARRTVIATGALERPLLFPGNDTPGVMLLSSMRTFAHRYGAAAGRRVLVLTNHSGAYPVACALRELGVPVAAIVDARDEVPGRLVADASTRGIEVIPGQTIVAVHGGRRVTAVTVAPLRNPDARRTIDCDSVAMAGGWTPSLQLHAQAGGTSEYSAALGAFVPHAGGRFRSVAGAANGRLDPVECMRDGEWAGAAAIRALGREPQRLALPGVPPMEPLDALPLWLLPAARGQPAFVDLASDVTVADLQLARREGYASIELAKRYTTAGMGIDQGKTANANVAEVLARANHVGPGAIGLASFRPPFTPLALGAIAAREPGALVRPVRETPMSAWHAANGAVMYESGANWRRPGYYLRAGERMCDAVRRESIAVRHNVGLYDSSPLGKFELRGPGAAEFLDRVYATRVGDLAAGRGRYALMLREDGRIFDDGVVFRLSDHHFWLTATTGNADAVHGWLEYLAQCVWRLPVFITPVTSQWANAVLCGPRARDVLATLGTEIDLDAVSFPFMAMRTGRVGGIEARVFRVSFTGELSFEINVPAGKGLRLWESLVRAGDELGITPVGSETNHLLRVEKGYISLGHEADGMATPFDLGLARLVAMDKPDFVGKRSLREDGFAGGVRRELVGLLPLDRACVLPEGAQVLLEGQTRAAGFVTASVMSVALERSVALALIDGGRARQGTQVRVTLERGEAEARIVEPVFYDPAGVRLRA